MFSFSYSSFTLCNRVICIVSNQKQNWDFHGCISVCLLLIYILFMYCLIFFSFNVHCFDVLLDLIFLIGSCLQGASVVIVLPNSFQFVLVSTFPYHSELRSVVTKQSMHRKGCWAGLALCGLIYSGIISTSITDRSSQAALTPCF